MKKFRLIAPVVGSSIVATVAFALTNSPEDVGGNAAKWINLISSYAPGWSKTIGVWLWAVAFLLVCIPIMFGIQRIIARREHQQPHGDDLQPLGHSKVFGVPMEHDADLRSDPFRGTRYRDSTTGQFK